MINHVCTIMSPKSCPYMDYIRQGIKHAEGRLNSRVYQKFKAGNTVLFKNKKEGIICKITFIHKYESFRKMLEGEGADKMLPQLLKIKASQKEKIELGIKIYENFPNSHKINQFGCLAIGVTYLKDHEHSTH